MRKVILSNLVTLDGFFAGPNGELDWFIVDEEFNEYSNDLLSQVDVLLFGRVTYQLMADFWPSHSATTEVPNIADKMNNYPKLFFQKRCKKLNGRIQS